MDSKLYSDNLNDDLWHLVTRIQPLHSNAFCTAAHRPEGQVDGDLVWLEAYKEHNDSWSVRKVSTKNPVLYGLDDSVELPEKIETILPGICFFDALYYCAMFETSQPDQGMIKAENGGRQDIEHYAAFAACEKIPFDLETGLPAPVAGGEILSDGTFLPAQRRAAASVTDNLLAENPAARGLGNKLSVKAPAPAGASHAARAMVRLSDSISNNMLVNQNDKRINGLDRRLKSGLKHNFTIVTTNVKETLTGVFAGAACSGGLVGSVLWYQALPYLSVWELPAVALGAVSLLGAGFAFIRTGIYAADQVGKGNLTLPRRAFDREMKKYRRHVDSLPDGDYKQQMHESGNEAELLFYKQATIRSFNKAANGGFWARRQLDRDSKKLLKIMQAQVLSDYRQAGIFEDIRSGKRPDEYALQQEIAALHMPVRQILHELDETQIIKHLAPPSKTGRALPPPG